MTNSLITYSTVSFTDDVSLQWPSSHFSIVNLIMGLTWITSGKNVEEFHDTEDVLLTVYLSEALPAEHHHPDFDAMGFKSRLSEMMMEDKKVYWLADAFLSTGVMEEMITVQQAVSLAEIEGLTSKYRHSHTLRRDFINKYSVIYPVACDYLRECKPEKINRTVHRPWMGMDGMAESALFVFLNGYPAFHARLTADLPASL